MAYELKEGQLTIFKNNNTSNVNAPAYKGKGMWNGEIFEISLWVREGEKVKYFSGKIKDEYKKQEVTQEEVPEQLKEDDLPF